MKKRADYEVGTIENKVEMQIDDALTSIQNLVSSLNTLKSALNDTINSTNNNKLKDNADSAAKVFKAIKRTVNVGAMYLGLRKTWSVAKDLANENIKMMETNNLFEVSMGRVVDEYGNLNEEASKYYTRAIAFQNEMNEKLGTNKQELQEYQAMYFSMLKSQGINKDASYMMSESLTKAGYDIASLYNLTVDDAMSKLKSGLAGQVEPLRKIGVDISESSLQKVLNDVGITDRAVQQLSYAEKEVARYIAIVNQAKQAQGDFARTFEQPANQIRVFKNEIAELKQVAGAFIVNTFGNLLAYVNAVIMVLKELLKSLASLFGYDLNIGGSAISDLSGGIDDIDSGLGSASKKAKELKKQLMGFDEINNIDPASQTGGGSGGGGATGGIDQKLLDALKEWDNMMDGINGKAQQIRDKILDWLGVTDGTYANLKRILEIVKAVGLALLTWKVTKTITDLFKNLGFLNTTQAFQIALGLTLAITGLYLLWNGTKRLLKGDVNIFSVLETMAGGAMSTFGIASFLHGLSKGKISWGKGLVIGFGVTLVVQGIEILKNGLEEKKISQILGGSIEMIAGIGTTIAGLSPVIKKTKEKIIDLGANIASSFKTGKHAIDTGTTSLASFSAKTVGVIAGIAGITTGSILAYKGMKDLTKGTADASTAILELAGGFATSAASGAVMGYTLGGPVGAAIGGLTGLVITGVTALISWSVNSEEASESTKQLAEKAEDLKTKFNEVKTATEEAVKSIEKDYDAKIQNAGYSEELAKKLYEVVDANGHIKAGNEDLVDYILGELNDAIGTNMTRNDELISSNGKVIGSHEQLQTTIDNTIKKYKEEAEQEAYQELYKAYVKERIQLQIQHREEYEKLQEAIKEYTDNGIANMSTFQIQHNDKYRKIVENVNELKEQYDATADELEKATTRENNAAKSLEKQIETTTSNASNSVKSFDSILENVCDNTEKNTKNAALSAEDALNKVNEIWEDTGNDIEKNSKDTLNNINNNAQNMSGIISGNVGNIGELSSEMYKRGIASMDTDTDSKLNSMMGVIKAKHSQAETEGSSLADAVERGVATIDTTPAGEYSVTGVAKGIRENKNNKSLLDAIGALKDSVITKFKEKFGIHSPSKVMAELSQYIPMGVAEGIDNNTYKAIQAAEEMADNVNSVVSDNIDISAFKNGIEVDTSLKESSFIDYGAITGQIQTNSNVEMSGNISNKIAEASYNAFCKAMREEGISLEVKSEEGIIVQKAAKGFADYVARTNELPFPVPI